MSGWSILVIYSILAGASLLVIMWMYHKAEEGYEHNGRHYKGKPPTGISKIPVCPENKRHVGFEEYTEILPDIFQCQCGTTFWFKDSAHWKILESPVLKK